MASRTAINAVLAALLGVGGSVGVVWFTSGPSQSTIFASMDVNIVEGRGKDSAKDSAVGAHCTTMMDEKAVVKYLATETGVTLGLGNVADVECVVMAKMGRLVRDGKFFVQAPKRFMGGGQQVASRPFEIMLERVLVGQGKTQEDVAKLLRSDPLTMAMCEQMISREIVDLFTKAKPTIFAGMEPTRMKASEGGDSVEAGCTTKMDEEAVVKYLATEMGVTLERASVANVEALVIAKIIAKLGQLVKGSLDSSVTVERVAAGKFCEAFEGGKGAPAQMIPGGTLWTIMGEAMTASEPFKIYFRSVLKCHKYAEEVVDKFLKENPQTVAVIEYSTSMDISDIFIEVKAKAGKPTRLHKLFNKHIQATSQDVEEKCYIESGMQSFNEFATA